MYPDFMNRNSMITWTRFIGKGAKLFTFITFVIFMVASISCTAIHPADNSDAGDAALWINCEGGDFTEGWCNENTYRIRLTVSPGVKSKTVKERKYSSKKSAILAAQNRILEKFKELGIDVKYTAFDPAAYTVAYEVKKTVKYGRIIYEKWDEDQNCEIIYEVSGKRLKRKVESAAFD